MTLSSPPEPAAVWGRSRILIATALLAAIQGVLFLLLSRWPTLPEPRGGPPFTVRLAPQSRDIHGAGGWSADPRQFSSNLRDGEASPGTSARSTPEYPLFRWEPAPRWLDASPGILWRPESVGTPRRDVPSGVDIAGPIPVQTIRPLLLKGETSVSLRGDLSPLSLDVPQPPPTSPVDDILPPTVIELVVGPGGDVIRARLAVGSGNVDADRAALNWARSVRCVTGKSQPGPGATDPAQWRAGDLIIHWNTRPASQR